jgi:ankyrin repeat protein
MAFTDELDNAIESGIEQFKLFIQEKMKANEDYLIQHFCMANGAQMTVLNYLIIKHREESSVIGYDLIPYIDHVLSCSSNVNIGQPLHLAIQLKKIKLALHLLGVEKSADPSNNKITPNLLVELRRSKKSNSATIENLKKPMFDVGNRNAQGRTLLSLVLQLLHIDLLVELLKRYPDVNEPSVLGKEKVAYQPLHQAITLDFADGVRVLAARGAQLANPHGVLQETPLLMAARLGKINALEALLENPADKLMLEAKNHLTVDEDSHLSKGHTAIEELCHRLAEGQDRDNALRGIAMLFCHGAEAPKDESMCKLLMHNRVALIQLVDQYLSDKNHLVDGFVNRCHLKEGALHRIFYADKTWENSWRHFFGRPTKVANIIENLVIRKNSTSSVGQAAIPAVATSTPTNLSSVKDPLLLYAEFVRRYQLAYDSQTITNTWSTMRWMIAEGQADWEDVKKYSDSHPTSRSRIIMNEMFSTTTKVHEDRDASSASAPTPM